MVRNLLEPGQNLEDPEEKDYTLHFSNLTLSVETLFSGQRRGTVDPLEPFYVLERLVCSFQ